MQDAGIRICTMGTGDGAEECWGKEQVTKKKGDAGCRSRPERRKPDSMSQSKKEGL